jgi:hypothetical protein
MPSGRPAPASRSSPKDWPGAAISQDGWPTGRATQPGSSWPVGTSTTSRAVTRQAAGTAPSPRWPSRCPSWATEVGENDCAGGFLGTLLPWADAHGIGCLAWAWDTASCGGGPSLITAYDGIPAAYGAAYKQYLASRPQPLDPTAKIDFEDGSTDGFGVSWGSTLSVAPEAGTAYSGSHGLALTVSGSGYPATATGRSLTGLGAGSGVTYHVWAPTGVSAGVSPMYFDSHWAVSVLSSQSLQPGWNTIAFTIPGTVAGLAELGLQVNDGSGWTGSWRSTTLAGAQATPPRCQAPSGPRPRPRPRPWPRP